MCMFEIFDWLDMINRSMEQRLLIAITRVLTTREMILWLPLRRLSDHPFVLCFWVVGGILLLPCLCHVPLLHKPIYVWDELFDPLQVIRSKFLDIVVPSTVNVIWRIFVLCGIVQLSRVIERDNLVTSAMYYEHWTVYVRHPIDIWEFVEWQCPA